MGFVLIQQTKAIHKDLLCHNMPTSSSSLNALPFLTHPQLSLMRHMCMCGIFIKTTVKTIPHTHPHHPTINIPLFISLHPSPNTAYYEATGKCLHIPLLGDCVVDTMSAALAEHMKL